MDRAAVPFALSSPSRVSDSPSPSTPTRGDGKHPLNYSTPVELKSVQMRGPSCRRSGGGAISAGSRTDEV